MSTHAILKQRMESYAGLADLVSNRVYRPPLPLKSVLPAITNEQISRRRVRSAKGAVHLVDRMQVNCFGATPDDCDAVAEQVVLALDDWQDASGTVVIRNAAVDDERDNYSGDSERYRRVVDVIVARSV